MLVVRAQTLPLLRLGKVFSVKQSQVVESANRAVILGVAQQKIALLVNELIGQESTVMKPLSSYLQDCRGLAGATVSGEGQVQLVLDPAGLLAATLPKPLAAGMPQ